MASDPILTSLPLSAATALAQLRRDNERLQQRCQQLEDQVRALVVLQGISNTLSAELSLPPLLRHIALAALRLTGGQAAAVYLVDAERHALSVEAIESVYLRADGEGTDAGRAATDISDAGIGATEQHEKPLVALGDGVAGSVAVSGDLVLVMDVMGDSRFDPRMLAVDSATLGIQPLSLVCVPMTFQGQVTGVLEVAQNHEGEGFDASSLDLMRTLAAQAATAVANARLYQRLRAEHERIIESQEDERKRLGRDLHDGPAQKLAQIVMGLEFAEKLVTHDPQQLPAELRTIRETALSTTREIRNLLFDLRPLVLDAEDGGLVEALKQFLERFKIAPGPRMHLRYDYPDRLSHNIELTTFAIVQEAVNNVLKHANAMNCWIEIREHADRLIATVRDDGDGFDVHEVQMEYETRGSWGLLNMLERASLIEAHLNIASHPGTGTMMTLEVPR